MNQKIDGLFGLIGLARKAGRLRMGIGQCEGAIITGEAYLVLLSADASDNTAQKVERLCMDLCPIRRLEITTDEVGQYLNRGGCAVLAVCDRGFSKAMLEKYLT